MAKQRTDTGDRRYEDIVHAAGELFAERGFNGTTLNDIANAVGVLKGSLYHHIASKEELLFDVIKSAHAGLLENMQLSKRFAADPIRQLAAFCYGHILLNAVSERIDRGIVFVHDSKHLSQDVLQKVTSGRDAYERYLRGIISRGKKMGLFNAELETRMGSFAVLGVLTSYIRWYKPGGQITPHDLARESAAFVLGSVVAISIQAEAVSRFDVVDEVIKHLFKIQNTKLEIEVVDG